MAKLTQRDRILQYLQDFGSITSYEAYTELGITQFDPDKPVEDEFTLPRTGGLFTVILFLPNLNPTHQTSVLRGTVLI